MYMSWKKGTAGHQVLDNKTEPAAVALQLPPNGHEKSRAREIWLSKLKKSPRWACSRLRKTVDRQAGVIDIAVAKTRNPPPSLSHPLT